MSTATATATAPTPSDAARLGDLARRFIASVADMRAAHTDYDACPDDPGPNHFRFEESVGRLNEAEDALRAALIDRAAPLRALIAHGHLVFIVHDADGEQGHGAQGLSTVDGTYSPGRLDLCPLSDTASV